MEITGSCSRGRPPRGRSSCRLRLLNRTHPINAPEHLLDEIEIAGRLSKMKSQLSFDLRQPQGADNLYTSILPSVRKWRAL
jgi:hypothetical protein